VSVRAVGRWCLLVVVCLLAGALLAAPAAGEQAGSRVRAFQAGLLDAGTAHTCAILHDGRAACWGADGNGRLGDDATLADKPTPVAVALPAGRAASAISAGGFHTCAILDNGSLTCWGRDDTGQLGDDATIAQQPTPVLVALPAGRSAVAISAGNYHTCAILDNGSAACWGYDLAGQLGDDATIAQKPTPVLVALPAGRSAVAISAGDSHTCAVLDDGSAACWGNDSNGQLGDDATLASKPTPVLVALPAGRSAVAISAGAFHTCAILDDGSAACWGFDFSGQLGDDATIAQKPTPVLVALPAGRSAVAISTGAGSSHTCAVLDNGSAACWGYDSNGQLGDDATLADKPTPVAVALPAGRSAVAISDGSLYTCALTDDGSAACWGNDGNGQLGNGLDFTQQPVAASAPAALATSSTVGRAADGSVTLEGAPGQLALAATASLTVRVTNAGPDPATGLRVQLQPALLATAPTLVSQGTVNGAYWDIGTLPAGGTTVLTLTLSALAAGAGSLSAQIAAQAEADPDSRPANGAASEDDQATAAIAITPAAAPPPPKLAPEKLTLALSTGRDSTAPHTTRARGRLVASAVSDSAGCVGTVTVTGKAGTKTLLTRTARLKLKDGACEYAATLTFSAKRRGKATSLKIAASFPGNDALLAAASKPKPFRLS
jgi:alpha-tubulin suppressor-like RCC1 family protein